MTKNYEFQIARADEAAVEAKQATLDNVKQRALRSEAAWRKMAHLTLSMDNEREKARVEREQRSSESVTMEQATLG